MGSSGVFRYGVFALFLAWAGLNVWMVASSPQNLLSERIDLLSSPFSPEKHMVFGDLLYALGNQTKAEQELAISTSLFSEHPGIFRISSSVLGAQSTPLDMQKRWNDESEQAARFLAYWKDIIAEKPDYRDAYLVLAALAHETNNDAEATNYTRQAYLLDPNNQMTADLIAKLGVSF